MKNKKTIIILASLIVLIGGIFLVNNIYQNKNKVNKTKRKRQNNLAIMIKENGATDYTKSNSKDIPKGDYVLNRDKSYCKNNGKIGNYDSTLGKVSFSFIGSDSCYLYFDYEVPGVKFETAFAANDTDIFDENGLRYEGANPNNYICLDNQKGGSCTSSSLLFRIIGLFDEDTSSDGTSSSGTKKLLKVIDTNNYGGTEGTAWTQREADYKAYNDWSEATLKTELNGTYLTTLLGTSNVNSKLSSGIVNAKWHLGGASSSNVTTLTADGIYAEERNPNAIYIYENYIINPSSIYAKVGLMYPSDYGYATVGGSTINRTGCRAKALHDYDTADCKNNDWLFKSQSSFVDDSEWLISPATNGTGVAVLDCTGLVFLRGGSQTIVYAKLAVRPTFYLDSSILKIVGTGDGTKDNAYRVG